MIGGVWAQVDGILSTLTPPERLAPLLATPEHLLQEQLTAELVAALGDGAADPGRGLHAPLGRRSLDPGLHHPVAARAT